MRADSLPLNDSSSYERAFAGATVHDFFNLIAVIVFLPLQIWTNFLGISAVDGSTIQREGQLVQP